MSDLHYHYRKYQKKDFQQLLQILIDFQEKSGLRFFSSVENTSIFYKENIKQKLLEKTKNCQIYVLLDQETIVGAAFYLQGQQYNFLDFMVKNPHYKYEPEMKDHLIESMKEIGFPIFAALDERKKFDKYVNFIKRKMNCKILGKDSMGKIMIKFYEPQNS